MYTTLYRKSHNLFCKLNYKMHIMEEGVEKYN